MLGAAQKPLRIATFKVDATPPTGTPLCDGLVIPSVRVDDPLTARGIILLSDEKPIVLFAIDWVGIANGGHDLWRETLAKAAGTTPDRVAVHALHQHDAPGFDTTAEEILSKHGLAGKLYNPAFGQQTLERAAQALRLAIKKPVKVTEIGLGRAKVDQVASNRRLLGPDGKVKYVRYTATRDPVIRAEPEGTIDPYVWLIAFWNGNRPLASLTYYATHPQSHYGKGAVTCDFPGLARGLREGELAKVAHIHFNGAGGNVTAGKYNDGAPENRMVLARRLAEGMKSAWENQKKSAVNGSDVRWKVVPVSLPLGGRTDEKQLEAIIDDTNQKEAERLRAGRDLAYLSRVRAGRKIELTSLKIGPGFVVHMPGELFIEYQLAAQNTRPDEFVTMAAYGEYGPGYIGTRIAYSQGGYETGIVSRTAPEVEDVLMAALKELLR